MRSASQLHSQRLFITPHLSMTSTSGNRKSGRGKGRGSTCYEKDILNRLLGYDERMKNRGRERERERERKRERERERNRERERVTVTGRERVRDRE